MNKVTTSVHDKKNVEGKKSARLHGYALFGIILLVIAIYFNGLHNQILTFDDNEYFQNYPEILNLSWKSIIKYFSNYYVIMYQPLPVLTFALNYYFTGLETFPLHAVNLLLHLGNVILLFYFIRSLTSNSTIAILVSLFFGVHPMNVEAVTWISARSSSMYTLFYLCSLIFYLKYIKANQVKQLLLVGLFFTASLFSKAQAVTFPVVLLLLDYYFGRNFNDKKTWLEKLPFFLLSIVFGLIALADVSTTQNIINGKIFSYSLINSICLVAYSFVFYIVKFILPFNLCSVYVYPPVNDGILSLKYYFFTLLFIILSIILFKYRNNKNVILAAGLFLITIAINIQIIPSRLFIVTERYAYFPYIGLFLLILLPFESWRKQNLTFYNKYKSYIVIFTGLIIFIFSVKVFQRNKIWKNDIMLISDIIEKNPELPYLSRAYSNRGNAYKNEGKLSEALKDYSSAIKIDSNDFRNFYNRALIYWNMNIYDDALADLNTAISIDSTQWIVYRERSQLRLIQSDTLGSLKDALKLLSLDSTNADGYNVIANISFGKSDFVTCESMLTKSIKMNPTYSLGMKNRGLLFLKINRIPEACSDFQQASYLGNKEAIQLLRQYCK